LISKRNEDKEEMQEMDEDDLIQQQREKAKIQEIFRDD